MARMQAEGHHHWERCPPATERTFDYAALRWETDYFSNAFVQNYCAIDISSFSGLEREFMALAERVAKEPLFFMHRDFQSQNLMVHNGVLRVIDFQGARKGLLYYDLASALRDAYITIPEHVQRIIIAHYRETLSAITLLPFQTLMNFGRCIPWQDCSATCRPSVPTVFSPLSRGNSTF